MLSPRSGNAYVQNQPLFLVCVHFKSDFGGSTDSCYQREAQAEVIRGVVNELGNTSHVVVTGDFNDRSVGLTMP